MYEIGNPDCNTTGASNSENAVDLAAAARGSVSAKIGGMVVMFILPFLIGLIPLKAVGMKNAARFTSIASCFGGGVFFGTCFMHLIPEVSMEINHWRDSVDNTLVKALPIAEILECLGFVLILLAESVVSSMGHGHSHGHSHGHEPLPDEEEEEEELALKSNGCTDGLGNEAEESTHNGRPHEAKRTKHVGVLIFALAVHSVFEGLAIAVEARTTVFLQLAGAILIHKCVVAFAVGTRLIEAGLKLKWGILINMTIFCMSTPIGIAIAMVILETLSMGSETTLSLVSGLIQGLSTGFFLYITFVEMICNEIQDGKDLLMKVLFLALGVTIIGISTVIHNYSDVAASHH